MGEDFLRRVFVYGTLRPGFRNWDHLLAGQVDHVELATLPGARLHDQGLPYVVWTGAAADAVHGDLMVLPAVTATWLLTRLDALEGHPDHYIRTRLSVTANGSSGRLTDAWVYLAGPEATARLDTESVVAGGDWAAHARRRVA